MTSLKSNRLAGYLDQENKISEGKMIIRNKEQSLSFDMVCVELLAILQHPKETLKRNKMHGEV